MKKNIIFLLLSAVSLFTFTIKPNQNLSNSADGQWIELMNGKDFTGWKANENIGTWTVVDGMFQADGKRSHLFYEGEYLKDGFKNFEIEVQLKTFKMTNSGILFHTQYQESGWPNKGMEIQVNNTHSGEPLSNGFYFEYKKMASLYSIRDIYKSFNKDNEWMTVKAKVESNHIQVWVNGLKTVDYIQPEDTHSDTKRLSKGTFCLQGHDILSKVQYKSFKVRRLPDDAKTTLVPPKFASWYDSLTVFKEKHFAFIDLNPQTKMTAQALTDYVYASGINASLLITPSTMGELAAAKNLPLFTGIKVTAQNQSQAKADVDYIIGESTSLTSAKALLTGQKINIWSDKGKILNTTNANELLALANINSVAIEINNATKSPSIEVLKLAKAKGLKFTFAGMIPAIEMDKSSYVFEAIRKANLNYTDLYIPKM